MAPTCRCERPEATIRPSATGDLPLRSMKTTSWALSSSRRARLRACRVLMRLRTSDGPATHAAGARPGDRRGGHLADDLGPAAPAVEAGEAVGAHNPDEVDARVAGLERADRIDRVLGADPRLGGGDHHSALIREPAGGAQPVGEV